MDITINTPALLFPAISLIMLAYTNRFLALASRVRALHTEYQQSDKKPTIHGQIRNLKYRLRLIKNMQALGVTSFICCIVCMYCIYLDKMTGAHALFGIAMLSFTASLVMSLLEIQLSTKALELELSDMEDLENPSLVNYIKSKF
ncbi:DUF2721 domain-containing protein [Segetibacter sp. 3557_3]|uniref:DUF2721 domain-containing protein n=1 Tax=Segetibacter sp. 3557_3 TaxID=2547429 RepID=UPI001058FFF4|nr:DUF2721 domain-containing protein [Segetibacter sp. 3557_3]TDH19802.1 DUF2721 domain-containing protein [Segetibacter sp. 3557_3]